MPHLILKLEVFIMEQKYDDQPFRVVMFVSRNKDNSNINGFKPRVHSFLTQKNLLQLYREFKKFSNDGVRGESSRMYVSVNERNHYVVLRNLQHYIIDHPDINLAKIDNLIASLSTKPGTAKTKRWLFDFDYNDLTLVHEFINDLISCGVNYRKISLSKTPNGFAVVTEHGFDTRNLLNKWEKVELKRDGMLFIKLICR